MDTSDAKESGKNLIKDLKYSYLATGPYLVIVESNDTNVGNLHPMAIGRILINNKIQGVEKTLRKGKNRIGIQFSSPKKANEFFDNKELFQKNNWHAHIPLSLVSSKGVARGVYKKITEEEIVNNATSKYKILEARLMK